MHFHTTSQNCEGGLRKQYTELLLKTLLFLKHTHTKGKSKPQTVLETEQKKKREMKIWLKIFSVQLHAKPLAVQTTHHILILQQET